jgi:5'-nucleotidase
MRRIVATMHILVTNDDGIESPGLFALKQALDLVGDVSVIAPDSNRSATARSITIRRPLEVDEVRLPDGTMGYATDGTPVDCVRFAVLGLLGGIPDVIVSSSNHGLNIGDDVTY